MLERGGNAFDAATAAGLVLQVAEPHLNGPGGEVPILCYDATSDEVSVVAGQGPAPANASLAHFRELGLDRVPGTGLLAACVPGAFDAWMRLALHWGRLPLHDLMEPVIAYAENGVPVLPQMSAAIGRVAELFRADWPDSAALWLAGGVPQPGQWFANPVLARTYRRILQQATRAASGREGQINAARDCFYRGFVAEAIACFSETTEWRDTSGRAHRGLLSGDDLERFEAPIERPVSVDYEGWTIYKPGPWSQGPVLCQQLRLLEGVGIGDLQPDGPEFVHRVVETAKLAFADREAFYGDPDYVDVPVDALLDPAYAAERRGLVGQEASLELRPGQPAGHRPVLPPALPSREAAGGSGEPSVQANGEAAGDTCHVDVVDGDGNVVSATPSGGWLQSSPVVPELGFPLGTRAQMFWLDEAHPNGLAGGKRPRTTLSCTLARRAGQASLAFGTPGGDQQDQWSLVFLLRHLHHGMNLQEAIDAPMFHSTHFPSSFYPRGATPAGLVIEERFPQATLEELASRGHRVTVEDGWSLGRLSAVAADGDPSVLKAGANPRGMQGYAAGR